jgi:hypothetical protein
MIAGTNRWRWASMLCVALHVGLVLELNFPGHLTVDSLIHLKEWQTQEFISYNPIFVTWWIGVTNAIWPEGGGAMLLATAMHAAAVGVLIWSVPKAGAGLLLAACCWAIWPVMLVYDGMVWKDVMFANAAVLAASLVWKATQAKPGQPRWPWIGLLCLMLPFLVLARQNGAAFWVMLAMGAAATLAMRWPSKLLLGLACSVLGLTLALALNQGLNAVLIPEKSTDARGAAVGFILLRVFDAAGILANDPQAKLIVPSAPPAAVERVASSLRARYSPTRLDTLDLRPDAAVHAFHGDFSKHWIDMVAAHPAAYTKHRIIHFAHILGLTRQSLCLPISAGTEFGAARDMGVLLKEPRSPWVLKMNTWFTTHAYGTPLFSHLSYWLLALAALVVLSRPFFANQRHLSVWQRLSHLIRAHGVAIGAFAGVSAFMLSFLFIGISCDFRYMYLNVPICFWLLIYAVGHRRTHAAEIS